tara:strand:- start:716 stop:919 length:204 start_codon:yes stop_codon:yes gene_type:complete
MKCSQGCDEEATYENPEWPQDPDQNLCLECYIGALEDQVEKAEEDLKTAMENLHAAEQTLKIEKRRS